MRRGTKPDTTKAIFLKTASSLDISPTARLAIPRRMPHGMTKHRAQTLGGHFLDGCCILPASVPCYFTAPSKASDQQSQDTESYLNVYHLHVLAPSSKLPPETLIMTGVSAYIDAIIICRSIVYAFITIPSRCQSFGVLGNQRLSSSTITGIRSTALQAHN